MTPLTILLRTRELLSDPARWTKGAEERDAQGRTWDEVVDESLSDGPSFVPVCWCLVGATGHIAGDNDSRPADIELLSTVGAAFGSVAEFNDAPETTHADVLGLIDRTIARLKARGDV